MVVKSSCYLHYSSPCQKVQLDFQLACSHYLLPSIDDQDSNCFPFHLLTSGVILLGSWCFRFQSFITSYFLLMDTLNILLFYLPLAGSFDALLYPYYLLPVSSPWRRSYTCFYSEFYFYFRCYFLKPFLLMLLSRWPWNIAYAFYRGFRCY